MFKNIIQPIEVAYVFVSSQFDLQFFLRCESLIFDAVLIFSTEVAEDDTISIIQNAAVDGKLGELSVNVSYYVTGSPAVKPTTPLAPISINSTSDDSLMEKAPIFLLFYILFYILFYG